MLTENWILRRAIQVDITGELSSGWAVGQRRSPVFIVSPRMPRGRRVRFLFL